METELFRHSGILSVPCSRTSCDLCTTLDEYDAATECTYAPSEWSSDDTLSWCSVEEPPILSEQELVDALIRGIGLSDAELDMLRDIKAREIQEDTVHGCEGIPMLVEPGIEVRVVSYSFLRY